MNGAWWAAAVKPIIVSFGAAFAALNLDLEPMLDIKLPLINKNAASDVKEDVLEKAINEKNPSIDKKKGIAKEKKQRPPNKAE